MSSAKRRPVLAPTGPNELGDFVGLPVTSRPQSDPAIEVGEAALDAGGLPSRSWVRVDHPVTLHAGQVVRVVARVRAETVEEAIHRLCAGLSGSTPPEAGGQSRP